MNKKIERPVILEGKTYKISNPHLTHAVYITINDHIDADGNKAPFEIFLNSKDAENFQWISALMRVISAVFRQGGDLFFLADELKGVFDPRGGYWKKENFIPSLVSEIGVVIELHLKSIARKPLEVKESA